MQYFRVGTERAKDRLFADIRALAQDADAEAAPRAHFSRELEPEYYEQLTAETWDPRRNRYVIKRGRRNEAIDCWVYAYAAANHPRANVPRLTPRQWAALAAQLEVALAPGLPPPEDGEAGPEPADAAPAPAPLAVPTPSPRPTQAHAPGAPTRKRMIDRRFIR
jgi:phage terminase large subunit GpA-like protein